MVYTLLSGSMMYTVYPFPWFSKEPSLFWLCDLRVDTPFFPGQKVRVYPTECGNNLGEIPQNTGAPNPFF